MLDRIHVALVAPPWFDVPPTGYGGIEQVVGDLAEALTRDGHEVTLVAAGRDGTPARLLRTYEEPPTERLGEALPEVIQAAAAARLLADLDVDVVHDHTLAGPLTAAGRRAPTVATMHGPVEGDLLEYYRHLDTSLVAISQAQRSSGARPELGRHRPQWHRRGHVPLPGREGGLAAVHRTVHAGQGAGSGDRSGQGDGAAPGAGGKGQRARRAGVLR